MSEEFALCWNNFTDNITTGFLSLLSHGNLCDVTLAVDGKLLKAHRIILSICSPYFQEMFITMQPNQHPILVLKDMNAKLVSNLLEFMYIGAVNVKQDELQDFMKIAETLQIKGLTTSSTDPKKSFSEAIKNKPGPKRLSDCEDSRESKRSKQRRGHIDLTDGETETNDDEQFEIIPIPEVSMTDSSFDVTSNKSRDSSDTQSYNLKISESHSLMNFGSYDDQNDPNFLVEVQAKNASTEYPNEGPTGSSITMLSSTSLLHGNCIFNRNNTVATQSGLKTYWLCKSYRMSMCKARCITHQGKVISATGVHNHTVHMNNKPYELPSGYSANVNNPYPATHEIHSNSNSSSQYHQPQHNAMLSTHHYFPHSLAEHQLTSQSSESRKSSHLQDNFKSSDATMSHNQVNCKMEQM